VSGQQVINNPQAAAASFAATLVSPPELAKTASAWHHIASLWIGSQELLHGREFILAEVAR
jgi:hypothetical protein